MLLFICSDCYTSTLLGKFAQVKCSSHRGRMWTQLRGGDGVCVSVCVCLCKVRAVSACVCVCALRGGGDFCWSGCVVMGEGWDAGLLHSHWSASIFNTRGKNWQRLTTESADTPPPLLSLFEPPLPHLCSPWNTYTCELRLHYDFKITGSFLLCSAQPEERVVVVVVARLDRSALVYIITLLCSVFKKHHVTS